MSQAINRHVINKFVSQAIGRRVINKFVSHAIHRHVINKSVSQSIGRHVMGKNHKFPREILKEKKERLRCNILFFMHLFKMLLHYFDIFDTCSCHINNLKPKFFVRKIYGQYQAIKSSSSTSWM